MEKETQFRTYAHICMCEDRTQDTSVRGTEGLAEVITASCISTTNSVQLYIMV